MRDKPARRNAATGRFTSCFLHCEVLPIFLISLRYIAVIDYSLIYGDVDIIYYFGLRRAISPRNTASQSSLIRYPMMILLIIIYFHEGFYGEEVLMARVDVH